MSSEHHSNTPDDGLEMNFTPFRGLIGDIRRRLPYYIDDYVKGIHPKVLASILFLFFACLANAVAFGVLTEEVTNGQIGTIEMILATAVGGIVFAIFSGQPLTILGGTGPIVIFTGLLYKACEQMGVDFLATYAWVGLWSSLFMILLALFNTSALMRYFTRFTDEIFAALIAVIFIYEAVKMMLYPFLKETTDYPVAFLTLLCGLGTYIAARTMKNFVRTPYTSRVIRNFISDFGPALAIGALTGFALFFPDIALKGPSIPDTFAPTKERDWLVPLFEVPTWVILGSSVPALMATILLFLDQNITTRLVNTPGNKLKKGAGFHLDLLVVGLLIGACSLFGLPWIVAATVHAINHVRSLATMEVVEQGTQKKEVIASVIENRVSPLMIHLMIGLSIFMLSYIKIIPMAVLFGLFLFMGFATLGGNQFWERVTLWVTDKNLYPNTHYVKRVPAKAIHAFTLIQVVALGALWVLKTSSVGILFPVLIAALVPIRMIMGKVFRAEDLEALDSEEDLDENDTMEVDVHA